MQVRSSLVDPRRFPPSALAFLTQDRKALACTPTLAEAELIVAH